MKNFISISWAAIALIGVLFCGSVQADSVSEILELLESTKSPHFMQASKPYAKLEAELAKLERSGASMDQSKDLGLKLAKIHLSNGNYQLALWALDRTGWYNEAQIIEVFLKEALRDPTSREAKGYGLKRGPYGIRYFEKDENSGGHVRAQDGALNESFSYELDRLIHLNRVPVNIQLGRFTRSLYVSDSDDSGIYFNYVRYEPRYKGLRLADSFAETYVFDYLIGAIDRHGGNSLKVTGYGDRLLLIDNADLGWSIKEKYQSQRLRGLAPKPDDIDPRYWKNARSLLDRIYAIDADTFHEKFDGMIGRTKVDRLLKNIETLRVNDPYAGAAISCGRIFAIR